MTPINQLSFSVSDLVNGIEVGTEHVPLSLLGDFQKDVNEFLRGSNREVNPTNVMIAIESGSLSFVATGLLAASSLWSDLSQIETSNVLTTIDTKRGSVLERWQTNALQHPNRRYKVFNKEKKLLITIDASSNFHQVDSVWVHVEKYVYGKVVDIGGKTTANVHLELESGETMKISSSQFLLADDDKNRLYRNALLHINAEQNMTTGKLRNMTLIGFETNQPKFDENEFNLMVEKGTKAWGDIPDVNAWLETLRGGKV